MRLEKKTNESHTKLEMEYIKRSIEFLFNPIELGVYGIIMKAVVLCLILG